MEFRLILHLHRFFADYRSSSRLFITNKIRTIRDLEHRISTIFNISDFYLISNSLYLPKEEDVRILKEDDIVVAIPYNVASSITIGGAPRSQPFMESDFEMSNISITEPTGESKPKRKRKHGPAVDIVSSSVDCNTKKSSKKVKSKRINIIDDSIVANGSEGTKSAKKEKDRNCEKLEMECDDVEDDESNRTPVDTNPKLESKENSPGSFQFSSTKPSFSTEFRRSSRKQIELMPISSSPKIVKSIRVYDTFANGSEGDVSINGNQGIENKVLLNGIGLGGFIAELAAENADKAKQTDDVRIKEEVIVSSENVEKVLHNKTSEAQDNKTAEPQDNKTECTNSNEESLVKTKRKRKRVRKKKAVPAGPDPEVLADVEFKPLLTSAAPSVHIRFEDQSDLQEKGLVEVAKVQQNVEPRNQNDVEVDQNDIVNCELQAPGVINIDYEKLYGEEILQHPLMKDMLPKKGDVVAFKIYRLSQSYTPEISNFIIARVVQFYPDDCSVVVGILVGGDQCEEPGGKFFMENCDNEEGDKSDERTFLWSDLLEPRLMFP